MIKRMDFEVVWPGTETRKEEYIMLFDDEFMSEDDARYESHFVGGLGKEENFEHFMIFSKAKLPMFKEFLSQIKEEAYTQGYEAGVKNTQEAAEY